MAWTSPRSWVPDEVVTADVMNVHIRDNLLAIGGAWTSYTPTLAQGVSTNISKTVGYAKYVAAGKLVICQVKLTASAAGTAGSAISVSLPVTAATSTIIVGSGGYTDSGTANYPGLAYLNSTTVLTLLRSDAPWTGAGIGADPNIAVASGDVYWASFQYEAA